jgi:hypothetical protein
VYVKGNRCFVNLEAAEHVETVSSRGITALRFTTQMNRELGITGEIDLERLTAPLVPSNAVVIAITAAGQTTAHPLAAFRVLRDGTAEPVFAVAPPKGAALFQMVGGHGLVEIASGRLFPDLASACAAITGAPTPEPIEPEQPRVTAGGRRHGTGTR